MTHETLRPFGEQRWIYVMERGFVLTGIPVADHDGLITLNGCGVIRKWGTTKGIGELAISGPTPQTVIDWEPDGTIISRRAVYRFIPVLKWPP